MKRYIAILTMILAVAACKKQGPFEAPTGIGETLIAHIGGPESKVSFDASTGKFAWSAPTDEIALHTSAGAYQNVTVQPSGVFTFLPEGSETRDGFAFYPAGVADGTAAAPVVTLPASYDIDAEGMGDWYPTPMIAVNDPADDDLWFYHVGAALHLTLNSVPAGTKKIAVNFGKGVTGTFDVADPSTATPWIAPAAAADEVSFVLDAALSDAADGLVINIPVPAGNYPKIQILAKDASDALLASGGSYKDWTFPRGRGRQLSYDFDLNIVGSNEFSVSPVKTVEFAAGNLWNISGTWQFAPAQYARLGVYSPDEWELFGLSTDKNNNFGMSKSTDPSEYASEGSEFVDWGEAVGDGWRTLQGREWAYMLGRFESLYQHDPNAVNEDVIVAPITNYGRNGGNPHALRGYATIYTATEAIEGFVILPDEWATPAGCRPFVGGRWQRSADAYLDNTYNAGGTAGTSGDWARMEAAGAVFLPACGFRIGEDLPFVDAPIKYNGYWSSSFNEEDEYMTLCVFVSNDDDFYGFSPLAGVYSYYGSAVRLVRDVIVGTLDNMIGEVGDAGRYGQGTL